MTDLEQPVEPDPGRDPDGAARAPEAEDPDVLAATVADDRSRVDGLEDRLRELENLFARAAVPTPTPEPPVPAGPRAGRIPVHATLAEFVAETFVPTFTTARGGPRLWCVQWWDHTEAVSRLQALWLSWESLRDGGDTCLGDWYRNHLDQQLPALMGPDGTFRACETGHWGGDDNYAADPDITGSVPPPDNRVWQTT